MAVAPDQNYEAVVARLKARAAQNSQPTAAVAPGAASLSAQPTPTPTEAPAQPTEPGLMDRLGSALNTAVDTGIRSTLALSPLGLLGSQHVARGALNAKDKLFKDNEQELADRTSQIERINRLNEDIRILGTVGIDRKDDPATRLAKVNQQRFLDGMDLLPDSEAKRYEDKGFSEIDYSQAGDVFGAVSIPRAMEQVYALRRMEDGKANARDLKSVADMLDRERNRYIPSKKYGFISPSGVTEGILFAIPFAIEMATTGGLATVGKKAGAGLVSKVGGRAIVNRVSEFMASTAGKKMTELTAKQLAGRGLVKLAAAPFEAAGRLPAIAPKFVAQGRIESLPKVEFTQEQAGVFRANLDATDESWGRETLRQGVSQYVELISEATGGAINIGGNLVGRAIGKLTPAQVRQVLGGMATFARRAGTKAEYAMGGRKALRITRKFREKALWDGLAAEWGEEDLSTALQWASTKISEFTGIEGLDLGQQSITAYGNPDELITRAGVLLGLRGASATPGWVASAGGSKKGGRKPVMLNKEQQAAVDEMSRQAMRAGASGPLGDLGVLDLEIEEADAEAQAAGDAVPPVDAQGDAVEAPGVQGSRVGADTVLDEIAQPQEQAPQTATDAPQVTALPTQVTADANEQSQGTTDTKTGPSSPAGVEVAPEAGTGVDRSPLTPETSTPEPIEKPAAEVVPPVEKPKVAAVAPAPKLEMEQSVVPEESAKKPLHKMTLDEYAQDRVRRAGGGDLKRQRRKGLPVHREAVKQAIERGEIVDYKVIKEYEGNFWADEYLDKVAKKFGEYDRKPYGKINRLGFSNLRGKPSSRIAKMGGFDAEAFAALDFHDVFDGISDAQMARLAPGKGKYGKVSLDRVAEMLSGQPALQGEFNEVDPYGRPVHDDVIEWLVKYLHQRVDTVRDMERAQDEFEKLDAMAEKHAEEQAARGELDLPEADQANDSNYDPSDIPFSAGLSSKQERAGKLKSHEREVVRGLNDAANGSKNDKIKVVQRKTDLPDGIQKQAARMGDRVLVDGAYDPATDTVYFVVEDMAKRARELGVNPRLYAAAKFLHEAGLHRGLRGMFESREAMDAFLDQVIETVGRDKLPGLVGEAYAGRPAREQAEEYLAGIAEKMVNGDYLTPKRRSVWKRLIAAAKDWLRRLGVKLRLSDAELNDVVARAVQWGLSGEPGAGGVLFSAGQSLSGSEKKLDAESQAEMEAALAEISRRDAMGEDRQKAMLRFLRAVLPAKERADVLREIREKRGDYIDQPDQYFQLALRSISRRVGQLQKSKGITVGRGKTLEQAARALEVILKGRGSQPAAVALRPGTIIKETYRAGEKKGFAKGFVRAVEDVIDTSFRKIASEYRGQYDRWEGALRTVEEELENLDAALAKRFPRETDEEFEKRAEFTRRRALINMFGEDRYGMIRRATKGDVEKSLERVRERMNVEWNRFYTKALTRITKRVNAKDLFNGPGDHNFADQWRKLVEPFKEIEKLVQKRRDLKALRSKLREDPGTTPAQFDNLEQQMNDIIEGIAKVWRSVPMKEARDLYTKFVALEAQSKAAVEAVKGLEKVKVFELGELVGGEVAANHDELNKKDGEKARRNRTFWKRFLIDSRGDMESRALTMGGGNEKSVSKKIMHDDIVEANSKAMTAHEDARADLRSKINELGITNREIDNIQGKVKLHKILGEQYGFTDAQLMDMYLILKREGMVSQVERNGVKSAERKGVNRIGKDLLRNYDPEVNLIEELNNVISTLDPKLLELADFMQRRIVDMSADGNVTALKILGKEKFLEQGYWPKSVDRSGTTALQVAKLEQLRGASPAEILTQLGMLQDTVPHGNPIVVNNVFDVFDDGALQMADFTHMAIPTIRALNVLNEANDEISGRLGLDFSRRIYDTIARATHLKKHSDNWNWLQRQASAIERRATTSILGFRFTSIANNLIGGSIFYASELAKIDPKLALDFIAQSGRAVMRGKRGDAANDRILQDGYFKHRWVSDPINVQGHLPTDVTTYKSATQRKIRRLQELGTRAMTWAEKNNAIRAYVTLTKNGYSEQEAVDLIQKMTRRTQNPSTAIEESGFYTAVKETGGAGLIFPFFGQPTVASNILLKDAQKLFYAMKTNNGKAKAATDLALTLSALSFNSIFASRLQLLIGLAAAGALGAGGDDDEKERQKWYAMSRLITEHFDSALPGIGYLFGDTASKFIESMVKDENSVGEAASDAFEEFRQFFNDNMFGSIVSRTGRSFSNVVEAWSDEDYEKLLKNSLNLADSLGALSGMPTGGFVQGGKVIGGLTGATVEEPSAGRGGGGSNF